MAAVAAFTNAITFGKDMNTQFVAANGARIPSLGFGTYGMRGRPLSDLLTAALKAGFRHIDTAQVYANEADVGLAIAQAGIARSDIFVTTKVWVANYAARSMARSVNESLRQLRSDQVDLLLLHWPGSVVPLEEQIGALNDIVRAGKARHIGVSNFNRALLARATTLSAEPLVTNQFEYHPYLEQRTLVSATREAGLAVTAYCAMSIGRVFDDPALRQIAARNGRTVAQVVLRWLIQQGGTIALSRTSNPDRLAENTAVHDFELSAEDMAAIFALARPGSRIVDPSGLAPAWDELPARPVQSIDAPRTRLVDEAECDLARQTRLARARAFAAFSSEDRRWTRCTTSTTCTCSPR